MNSYETVYILRTDLPEESVKKINGKIEEVLARRGGKILSQTDLGTKSLAYRIERQTRGRYFGLQFQGGGEVLDDVEKNLRLTEDVLRFLTIRLPIPRPTEEGGKKE